MKHIGYRRFLALHVIILKYVISCLSYLMIDLKDREYEKTSCFIVDFAKVLISNDIFCELISI